MKKLNIYLLDHHYKPQRKPKFILQFEDEDTAEKTFADLVKFLQFSNCDLVAIGPVVFQKKYFDYAIIS